MNDVVKDLYSALVSLWRSTTAMDLISNLGSDALQPATNLIIDQLHILASLHQRLKLSLKLLLLDGQMCILSLALLHVVLEQHERVNFGLMCELCLLIVNVCRPLNRAAVLIGNLELSHSLGFFFVLFFQLVVLLLICCDSDKEGCIGLLLCHKLSDNLAHILVVSLAANLLEARLNVAILGHFSAHAFLKEG